MRTLAIGGAADEAERLAWDALEREAAIWRTGVLVDGEIDLTSGDECGSLDDATTQADTWARDVLDAGDAEPGVSIVVVHRGEVVHVGGQESSEVELQLLYRALLVAFREKCGRFESLYAAAGEMQLATEDLGEVAAIASTCERIAAQWVAEREDARLGLAKLELVRDPEAATREAVAS